MWSAVLLICSAAAAALSSAEWQPRWRGQIEPKLSAHQGLLAEAELPWSRVDTLRSGAGQHLPHVRTKRKLKPGSTHAISSFNHIPGKALNIATRIVHGASARDCAVHCITSQCKAWSHNNATNQCRFLSAQETTIAPVPVLQPDSDYYEISLKRLGAALISFFIDGVTSHTTNINQNQIFLVGDPLDPKNILTDFLEPLPSRPPVTEPPSEPPSVPTDHPVTDPPTPPPPLPSEVPTAGPTDAPTLDPDLSYKFDFPVDCGRRPTFGLRDYERRLTPSDASIVRTRVIGGSPVAPGSYPWQAEIQISNNKGFQHSCGGIVISSDLIMTAAHCHTEHESKYQVGVAVNDILTSDDPGQRMIAVENIYRHFAHRPDLQRGQRNDIAIMRLKFRLGEPHGLTFSDYIQPLCLPERNTTLFVGQECQISGWGLVDANLPNSPEFAPNVLRGAVINILDPDLCYKPYGDRFDERLMICAGRVGGGVDTCSGDSGGPLSCRDSFGRWFVAGIVSFGWECGAADHPGVYTRVSAYLEFVHRTAAFLTGVQVVD